VGVGRSWVAGINIHRIPAFLKRRIVFRRPWVSIFVVRPWVSGSLFPIAPRLGLIVLEGIPGLPIFLWSSTAPTTRSSIVNQEAGFADEVVMVIGDGEVVDGFLAW
jgi:hypothetical protein